MERDGGDSLWCEGERLHGAARRVCREWKGRTVERHLVTPAFCTAAMGEGFGKKLKESTVLVIRRQKDAAYSLRPPSAEGCLLKQRKKPY